MESEIFWLQGSPPQLPAYLSDSKKHISCFDKGNCEKSSRTLIKQQITDYMDLGISWDSLHYIILSFSAFLAFVILQLICVHQHRQKNLHVSWITQEWLRTCVRVCAKINRKMIESASLHHEKICANPCEQKASLCLLTCKANWCCYLV